MDRLAIEPQQIFSEWVQLAEAMPEPWKKISSRISWTIRGSGGGTWLIDSSRAPALQQAVEGQPADCYLEMSEEQFVRLFNRTTNPQSAFIEGTLRVAGSLEAAIQCNLLFDIVLPEERAA